LILVALARPRGLEGADPLAGLIELEGQDLGSSLPQCRGFRPVEELGLEPLDQENELGQVKAWSYGGGSARWRLVQESSRQLAR
jgi:hypothetical protein